MTSWGGVGGEDDEVGVHTFGDPTGVRRVADVVAEDDLAASVGVGLKLLGCGAHIVRAVFG
ncbi:MAG TPA: hypothetical protein VMU26_01240 [Candidatus Polarisedimenticolia bacterium]|nr:hypothetical protein [Candidatus Polarisedimenticolia bacterium]